MEWKNKNGTEIKDLILHSPWIERFDISYFSILNKNNSNYQNNYTTLLHDYQNNYGFAIFLRDY